MKNYGREISPARPPLGLLLFTPLMSFASSLQSWAHEKQKRTADVGEWSSRDRPTDAVQVYWAAPHADPEHGAVWLAHSVRGETEYRNAWA